jgi:ubiquinone/menaquinone biosynthesis C-methylase UbiE
MSADDIVEQVKDRYGRIALGAESGCCASGCGCGDTAQAIGYGEELSAVPEDANLGLGCGAPVALLELKKGEVVLDLGSGAGIDAFLAAREVGPEGRVIGVDMTPPMVERARRAAERHGIANVEFREGRLEALPVESGSIDAITSNCVINLVPDKAAVFREVARVLKPGGRLVISDIVLDGALPESVEKDVYAYVGCISGALRREPYFAMLESAGLRDVEILKDIDYLGAMIEAAPEEVQALLARTGVRSEQVIGKVRSLTFRACKRETTESCCGPKCCA